MHLTITRSIWLNGVMHVHAIEHETKDLTLYLNQVTAIFDEKELNAYAKAGSIAEETISAIRTVMAFGCQIKESDRFRFIFFYC